MNLNTAVVNSQECHSLRMMISSWAEHFPANLFWIAFLQNGQVQKVIHNPARKAPQTDSVSLLASLSEIASELSAELCTSAFSRILVVTKSIQYICFCRFNKPWLILCVDRAINLEMLWRGISASTPERALGLDDERARTIRY